MGIELGISNQRLIVYKNRTINIVKRDQCSFQGFLAWVIVRSLIKILGTWILVISIENLVIFFMIFVIQNALEFID